MTKHYHLIGIGGIGMGTIASLLLDKGYSVGGSDVRENPMVRRLRNKGARIVIGHDAANVMNADVVVYSSAISGSNCELAAAEQHRIPTLKRAQVLSELMREHKAITVAGAHGKTTTTSMIGQMMSLAGLQPTSAIGGIVNGEHSHAALGQGKYFVAEVDESDGSFLYFSPFYSVITNMDLEHLDYYHSWKNIAEAYGKYFRRTADDGLIIAFGDDKRMCDLIRQSGRRFVTFGFSSDDLVMAINVRQEGNQSRFECLIDGQRQGEILLNVPGRHNIANALACICLGYTIGVDMDVIRQSLQNYTGVQRRFEELGCVDNIRVIDDYAHHPTEIATTLQTAKECSEGRVIALFQPHRYTRLKALWRDFMDSMIDVDHLIVSDVYAASENPIDQINAQRFVQDIQKFTDKPVLYIRKENILNHVLKIVAPGDLVITLGAGDINRIGYDIVEHLRIRQQSYSKSVHE